MIEIVGGINDGRIGEAGLDQADGSGACRRQAVLRAAALAIGVSDAGVLGVLGTTTNDLIASIFVLAALLPCLRISGGITDALPPLLDRSVSPEGRISLPHDRRRPMNRVPSERE
jgi:hypothetical protein